MNTLATALPGPLTLHPGAALPTITGTPQPGLLKVVIGRPARELPMLLGALFTLCGETHRRTAARAVAAAQGQEPLDGDAAAADRLALRWATAREQMLRLGHDWPLRRVANDAAAAAGSAAPAIADDAAALRHSPLWQSGRTPAEQLAALPGWLERHWLHGSLDAWLTRHEDDPRGWAAHWCATAPGPLAALLRQLQARSGTLSTPALPLDLLDDPADTMPTLAARMAAAASWSLLPDWRGAVPDTGPWTRQRDRLRLPADNAWMRIVSRLADLLRLARRDGSDWLSHGALTLPDGAGIAWSEMARGLLVHWVRLEAAAEGPRIAQCAVLSPTAWNFHPQGVLAQALSALAGDGGLDLGPAALTLALAFDPCVAVRLAPTTAGAGEDSRCTS